MAYKTRENLASTSVLCASAEPDIHPDGEDAPLPRGYAPDEVCFFGVCSVSMFVSSRSMHYHYGSGRAAVGQQ
jgi:hypothetical protein